MPLCVYIDVALVKHKQVGERVVNDKASTEAKNLVIHSCCRPRRRQLSNLQGRRQRRPPPLKQKTQTQPVATQPDPQNAADEAPQAPN